MSEESKSRMETDAEYAAFRRRENFNKARYRERQKAIAAGEEIPEGEILLTVREKENDFGKPQESLMLDILPMRSAHGAANYYDSELSRSDYYAKGLGIYGGLGAERLGLKGEVSRETFVDLLENRDPRTKETLTARTKENRRVGYELTFSVPKSVSLYLAETGDPIVETLAHEAFKETMADIEASVQTRVRIGDANYDRTTGNLVYASFVHREARPVDARYRV